MRIGISTACFYPMETEMVLQKLIGLGFRTFEIFLNSPRELYTPFLQALKKQVEEVDGRIVSLHPFTSGFESFLLFSQYKRRFEDGLIIYEDFYKAAQMLGADILVIHGEKNLPYFSDDEYIERFHRLVERGKEYGIRVAQENVVGYRGQRPEFIRKMREQLGDNAYFVLDIKQCIRSKVTPLAMCDAMGARLIHMHANDHSKTKDCLLAGEGQMEFIDLFRRMKENGFSGSCILEVYSNAIQSDAALIQSREILKDYAARVGFL